MKVQLLVSEWCAPCRGAEEVWRLAAERKDFAFEVLDVGQPEGRAVVARLAVKTVPAGVVDGALKHVGVPTLAQALEFVAAAPDKAAGGASYVGITLGVTGRWAIAAAAAYLVLAGAGLAFGGGIAGDAPWRPVAVRLFGLRLHRLRRVRLRRARAAALRRRAESAAAGSTWSPAGLAHAGVVLLADRLRRWARRRWPCSAGCSAAARLVVLSSRLAPVLAHAGR